MVIAKWENIWSAGVQEKSSKGRFPAGRVVCRKGNSPGMPVRWPVLHQAEKQSEFFSSIRLFKITFSNKTKLALSYLKTHETIPYCHLKPCVEIPLIASKTSLYNWFVQTRIQTGALLCLWLSCLLSSSDLHQFPLWKRRGGVSCWSASLWIRLLASS